MYCAGNELGDDVAQIPRQPTQRLFDDGLLQKARDAENGEKFERLLRGSTAGYESHSGADMVPCSLLAFCIGSDEQQIDRIFRDSGLIREKWDEVHYADGSTYGEKTIERAVAGTHVCNNWSARRGSALTR